MKCNLPLFCTNFSSLRHFGTPHKSASCRWAPPSVVNVVCTRGNLPLILVKHVKINNLHLVEILLFQMQNRLLFMKCFGDLFHTCQDWLDLSGLHLAVVISFGPRQSANCCQTAAPEHSGFDQTCSCLQSSSISKWNLNTFTCDCTIYTVIDTESLITQVLHEQIKYCFIEFFFFSSIQQESIMATIKCA